jgi:hypothetical protein
MRHWIDASASQNAVVSPGRSRLAPYVQIADLMSEFLKKKGLD